jgi:hypothetical protein
MPFLTTEHAAMMAAEAGKPWRPSNGQEGLLFMEQVCEHCAKDCQRCDILGRMFLHLISSSDYPSEMQVGTDGHPCCIAFSPTGH